MSFMGNMIGNKALAAHGKNEYEKALQLYNEAYEKGIFDNIYTTNLVHCPNELLHKQYYVNVDMSAYISLIIDTLNHDTSVNNILDATSRIQELVKKRLQEQGK